jgi:hypothetical protein
MVCERTGGAGARVSGFPVELGGVRANYHMPRLAVAELGGGTIVRRESPQRIGPDGVSERLMTDGVVFGRDTMRLSDVSVSARRTERGT